MKSDGDDASASRQAEVLRLYHLDELSIRAIGRRLQMSRKTVRQMLGNVSRERRSIEPENRPSLLDPHESFLRAELKACPELKAPAMLERLRQRGFTGGITIVRERLRLLRPTPMSEAFLTQHFVPGQIAMVDWADFGFALPGVPRRVSAFVMTLGYSRELYLEYTLSQQMGTFLRCMERAVAFFGGVTLCDVFDNMKTVVREHRAPHPPVFNARFVAYAAARGFAIHACHPRRANEKGGVERGIRFVRDRFWPGRQFSHLADLNRQAAIWRDTFANNREHHITGKVPQLVFDNEEKKSLRPVQDRPFDVRDEDSGTVTKTFRIRFDRNQYSVPWRLVGQHVTVRADDEHVDVFLGPKPVARHSRSWDIRADIEEPSHKRGLKEYRPKAAADELPHTLTDLADPGRQYFRILAAGGRSVRREALRLCLLCELFGYAPVRTAMEEVMQHGHVGVEYVEYLLRHDPTLRPAPAPLRLGDPVLDALNANEPDLSVYDRVLCNAPTRNPRDIDGP
jgi:transposase